MGGGFGCGGFGGGWVDDAFVSVARNGVSVVVELAAIGIMG